MKIFEVNLKLGIWKERGWFWTPCLLNKNALAVSLGISSFKHSKVTNIYLRSTFLD